MKTTIVSGQLSKILELLDQKGVTPEMIQARLESGVLADIFETSAEFGRDNRDSWRKAFGLNPLVPEPIILTIDYTKSLEEMVVAGLYDWKNDNLDAKRFPVKGTGTTEVEAKIFHFNRNISSEDAKRLIEEAGYEVAKTEHLLAFGAKYPDEQRKFPIVALGSAHEVVGDRRVPCLDGDVSRRGLYLHWWDFGWNSDCRFLAVRKVTRE
ncbi:MAG: hypothetical protein WCV55_00900 [Candidatus Paceibacterota bacterium]